MQTTETTLKQSIALLILRLSTGGLLLFHGIAKLSHGHAGIKQMLIEKGLWEGLLLGVPLTEVIAPLLLMVGIFTRLAGVGIVILMLTTIFLAHMPNAFTLTETGGLEVELNLLYLCGALAIAFAGPGKYSVYHNRNELLQ